MGEILGSAMADEIADQAQHLDRLIRLREELQRIAELKAAIATIKNETRRRSKSPLSPPIILKVKCKPGNTNSVAALNTAQDSGHDTDKAHCVVIRSGTCEKMNCDENHKQCTAMQRKFPCTQPMKSPANNSSSQRAGSACCAIF